MAEELYHITPLVAIKKSWGKLSQHYPVAFVRYRDTVLPILQGRDPICGFVAIAMAGSVVGRFVNVEQMVQWARVQGYTYFGEMLDVRYMQAVTAAFIGKPSAVMDFPTKEHMLKDLFDGKIYIVPYDVGSRGRPSLNKGARPHWALVFGAVVMQNHCSHCHERLAPLNNSFGLPLYTADSQVLRYHGQNGSAFVLAYQGQSSAPQVWSYQELFESTMQLHEVGELQPRRHVTPAGGISVGLRGRVLRVDV